MMIINDNKGGKEIAASGKITDEDIVKDTNDITLKKIHYVRQ